jgi:hypothetical protein
VTSEADRKRQLVAEINQLPGGYARRIEDRWRVGVLDLILKLPGQPVTFAEGKLIEGNLFEPSPTQWEEGLKIMAAGIPVLLLGWKKTVMFVSPWVRKAHIDGCYFGTGPKVNVLLEYFKLRDPK